MSVTGASIKELLNFVPMNEDEANKYKNVDLYTIKSLIKNEANDIYKYLLGGFLIELDDKITLDIINKEKESIEQIINTNKSSWERDPDAFRYYHYYGEEKKKINVLEKIVQTYIQIYNNRETSNSCVLTLSSSEPSIED